MYFFAFTACLVYQSDVNEWMLYSYDLNQCCAGLSEKQQLTSATNAWSHINYRTIRTLFIETIIQVIIIESDSIRSK